MYYSNNTFSHFLNDILYAWLRRLDPHRRSLLVELREIRPVVAVPSITAASNRAGTVETYLPQQGAGVPFGVFYAERMRPYSAGGTVWVNRVRRVVV